MSKIALFGVTGLIGSTLAPLLSRDFETVLAPVRRELGSENPRIQSLHVDFENLEKSLDEFKGIETFVYCLGTTRNKAGSFRRFREIEWALATSVSNLAKRVGVKRFVLLSSKGASSSSFVPYLRTKGQIERFVVEQGFPELVIARPSLLIGERAESRIMEDYSIKVAKPLIKPLQKYLPKLAPIQSLQLAEALAKSCALTMKQSHRVLENSDLVTLAGEPRQSVIELKS